ncbi:MAG: DUF4145 domain-containing protein [Methylocella sp.]|jgi:hypothetical protein
MVKWDDSEIASINADHAISKDKRQEILVTINKLNSGVPFLEYSQNGYYLHHHVYNLYISQCFSCNEVAIWLHDRLIFPQRAFVVEAAPDMPANIKLDFEEARQIFPSSPRGSAALLRLSIQKLCVELGEKGKNINADIASLVQKGLSPEVQKALDIVRVIGNEAVHPGQIDWNDDPGVAKRLFDLVNFIVDEMISRPKTIAKFYDALPSEKLEEIAKRDKQKSSGG